MSTSRVSRHIMKNNIGCSNVVSINEMREDCKFQPAFREYVSDVCIWICLRMWMFILQGDYNGLVPAFRKNTNICEFSINCPCRHEHRKNILKISATYLSMSDHAYLVLLDIIFASYINFLDMIIHMWSKILISLEIALNYKSKNHV